MRDVSNLKKDGISITDINISEEDLYNCVKKFEELVLDSTCHAKNDDNFTFIKHPLFHECFAKLAVADEILKIPFMFFEGRDFFLGTSNLRRSKATSKSETTTTVYHRDQNLGGLESTRGNFLKVFIYLTDVSTDNGPFAYIKGSNSDRKESSDLYRVPDQIVYNLYGKDKEFKCTAPAGSVITADTTGLHKGTKVVSGYRDMLTINFCTIEEKNTNNFNVNSTFLEKIPEHKKALFRNYNVV